MIAARYVPKTRITRYVLLVGMIALAACEIEKTPAPEAATSYTPVAFDELPGWDADALAEALPAWQRSCARMAPQPDVKKIGPSTGNVAGTVADWRPVCAGLDGLPAGDSGALRSFIEANLVPLRVRGKADDPGLFTGYFEPIIEASRERTPIYHEPIYALPRDHVSVRLEDFDPELKGHSIVGRVENGRLVPYRQRGEIEAGAINDSARILFWARDTLDVFILQVQGSGIAALPDGSRTRIGFAGHNGHNYGSVGRWLIENGKLDAGRAGWEDIRAWLEANPKIMRDTLAVNRRFIFFREIDGDGPTGAAGVTLTAERSMAVDPKHVPLNVPVWLDAEHPDGNSRLQRLMVAQDTGNAIRGAVRGDFYWGTGRAALDKAGRMKSRGAYYILVPRTLVPAS
ncbi:MAG: murein transglycosylase A [Rhodospirillaceae bacterium]|nr:murein transglycosylase A [Rhodospirillaceae bacterium]MBT5944082.1 murein transglycosylase A [Rhodospirillaceae bacterium]MBT6402973.1 murein transglycosylase A [Rhodospirillaceae bacterium]MBT6537050.1 murein transglycosylase A [Rhodospirillaceae bacterium]